MVAGADAARFGEAKNSWLTGTAAWTFVNLSQALLGIQPEYDGLAVNPCLPKNFGDLKIKRRYRDAEYYIDIRKPDGVEKGVAWMEVDGKKIARKPDSSDPRQERIPCNGTDGLNICSL